MPIFDQGYQHWNGRLSGHVWRWLAITRHGLRTQFNGRYVRMLLLTAWTPALVLVAALAFWGMLEQGVTGLEQYLPPALPLPGKTADPHAYRWAFWTIAYSYFFRAELFFIMLLVTLTGPNLISRDLRFNALPLYLSRPLTRLDYFIGKLGVIAGLVAIVAVLPAAVAYVLGVCFSLDVSVIGDTWRILPASILYGLLIVVSAGTLMLALSSMSRRSLYVGLAWFGLWVIGSTVASVLEGLRWEAAANRASGSTTVAGPGAQPRGPHRPGAHGHGVQPGGDFHERVQDTLAEDAPTDWRPLFSYASNLNRIGDAAFGTDAAYVTVNRAFNASQAEMTAMLGVASGPWSVGMPPPPTDDRRFANQNVLQYPWTWSASVLAALLGISLCILSTRVKSLDRLR